MSQNEVGLLLMGSSLGASRPSLTTRPERNRLIEQFWTAQLLAHAGFRRARGTAAAR